MKKNFDKKNKYYEIINQVIDPEVGIGIADMGLIYSVEEKKGIVKIFMTLTSMGCPLGQQIMSDIDGVLRFQDNVKDVEINLIWDPPWTPDRMNPELRSLLFGE